MGDSNMYENGEANGHHKIQPKICSKDFVPKRLKRSLSDSFLYRQKKYNNRILSRLMRYTKGVEVQDRVQNQNIKNFNNILTKKNCSEKKHLDVPPSNFRSPRSSRSSIIYPKVKLDGLSISARKLKLNEQLLENMTNDKEKLKNELKTPLSEDECKT